MAAELAWSFRLEKRLQVNRSRTGRSRNHPLVAEVRKWLDGANVQVD
jgi:hypothetical protein